MIGSGINIEPVSSSGALDNEGSAILKICLQGQIQTTVQLQGVINKC